MIKFCIGSINILKYFYDLSSEDWPISPPVFAQPSANRYNRRMSKITPEEVRRIATLANIGLEEAEIGRMASELDQIVGFVERLQSVDTAGIEPTDQVTGLVDVWRPDEVYAASEKLSRDELMANAPEQQDGFFKVKRVLDND